MGGSPPRNIEDWKEDIDLIRPEAVGVHSREEAGRYRNEDQEAA